MKKITVIKMDGDPYCAQAYDVLERLKKEYPMAEIETIDAKINPELVEVFARDYLYVPSMFIEGKKFYESHPGESYEECLANVKKVFEAAL